MSEKKFRRVDPKSAESGSMVISKGQYLGRETKTFTNKSTGRSFPSTDLLFEETDGTRVYVKEYAGLKRAIQEQEVMEGDFVNIEFNGVEEFTNKYGKPATKYLFDLHLNEGN